MQTFLTNAAGGGYAPVFGAGQRRKSAESGRFVDDRTLTRAKENLRSSLPLTALWSLIGSAVNGQRLLLRSLLNWVRCISRHHVILAVRRINRSMT